MASNPDIFATTRWSVVLAAGAEESKAQAMETLCRDYWSPVYQYVRRRCGHDEQAEDLTQEFFAKLLEKDLLQGLNRAGGKFRAFLLTMVKRFLISDYQSATAQKRGGGAAILPLEDTDIKDTRRQGVSPDEEFDRRWALTVIDRAASRLRDEQQAAGRGGLFQQLSEYLPGDPPPGRYEELAGEMNLSRGGLAMAVHRLRRRWRELIRAEISDTLSNRGDLDQEMDDLMAALRR